MKKRTRTPAETDKTAAEENLTAAPAPEEATEEATPAPEEVTEEATPAEENGSAEETSKGKKSKKSKKAKKAGKAAKGKKGKAKKIVLIAVAALLCVIILVVGIFFGVGSCNKTGVIPEPEVATTTRKAVPTDGSTPEDHVALDNVAYMAYVLDQQQSYHSYANNSTKSTGYEQITQTWKDYKVKEVDGQSRQIMISSDLSYSALVKSSAQTCFVDNKVAYRRTGDKPGKDSVPTDINWATGQPKQYTQDEYLKIYGQFSTELSVYVINEGTVTSASETVNNGDGTYSQTFVLNSGAACWYQYVMKTNGGLKDYPSFEKIEITFTFDAGWRVLSTYCEEKATIAPGALGGFPMSSNAKTTTTFSYDDESFDYAHYGYFDSYFSAYLDKDLVSDSEEDTDEVNLTDVLMGGFGKVISEEGQQFALSLKLGETNYNGKIFLSLTDLEDVLNTLNVRLSLGKGDGAQDLYAEFGGGVLNVYYSDGFALTADIDKLADSVGAFSDWINGLSGDSGVPATMSEDGGIDLESLLNSLTVEPSVLSPSDTKVKIYLDTDDLLGLGIGVDLELNFSRTKTDGINTYAFEDLKLNKLSFKNEEISLNANIVPDSDEKIFHNAAETPASISDYIDGVLALVNSKSYVINLTFDGTGGSVSALEGLKLNGTATVEPSSGFGSLKVSLPLTVEYKNLSAELTAFYTIDFASGDYGEIYLHLTKVCGNAVEAKVCCDIKDVVASVTKLIDMFTEPGVDNAADDSSEESSQTTTVAEIINTVLNLDFGAIITELKADGDEIKVTVDADGILQTVLAVLNKQFDIELGSASITVKLTDGKVSLDGEVTDLGLTLGVSGSDSSVTAPDASEYADITEYIDGVYELLNSETIAVELALDGTCESISYISGAKASGTALVKFADGFGGVEVQCDNLEIDYNELTLTLGIYYTVNFADKTYGKIYINLTELDGVEVSAKVCCDIGEVITAVTALINTFKTEESATPAAYAEVAEVVDTVVSINFGDIITKLNAGAEKIELGANLDEILKALKVNLGVELGEVNLALSLTDGKVSLNGEVTDLGLTLGVSGSDSSVTAPTASEYADITEYIDGVYELLKGETIAVSLNLDGTCESISYISGAKASGTALVKFADGFGGVEVQCDELKIDYDGLTLTLGIYYTVNFADKTYGKIYINLTELDGVEVSAKVSCDIGEVITAVTALIDTFKTEESVEAAAYAEVAEVIDTVVSINFGDIITKLNAGAEQIELGANLDEILKALNVDLGVSLGEVNLALSLTDGKVSLDGEVTDLGLTLGVSGSDAVVTAPDASEYADITEYIDGVTALLKGESLTVELKLVGSKCVALDNASGTLSDISPYIKDITAEATAQVKFGENFGSVAVSAPVSVTYKNYTAKLEIYYEITFGSGYGSVYITLTELNGTSLSARISCDIGDTVDAVKSLISLFQENGDQTEEGQAEAYAASASAISTIIDKIVSIDYKKLINTLTADGTGIQVNLSADALLTAFNVTLNGITLGDVQLDLGLNESGALSLDGSVPTLGLTLGVSGSSETMPTVDKSKYLDAVQLLQLVEKGVEEGKAIAEAQAVAFDIQKGELIVDGVKMSVTGDGEVSWANGVTRVALDLALEISESENKQSVAVKFVYDEAATASHLITVAINKNVLYIDKDDIDGVSGGLESVISSIKSLISAIGGGTESGGTQDGETQDGVSVAAYAADDEQTETNSSEADSVSKALAIILGYASNLKIQLQDASAEGEDAVKNLVISYADSGVLTLGANGNLSLTLSVKNGTTQIADISVSVDAPASDSDLFATINASLTAESGYTFYKTEEGTQFTKAVYDYAFAVLDDLSVGSLLGGNTYVVHLTLDGKNSGISALEGVYVNAEIHYTEIAETGETADGSAASSKKLVEIELNELTVNDFTVKATAAYYDGYLYITLSQIGKTTLYGTYESEEVNTPIMLKASADKIYLAVDDLVRIITSDNVSAIINLLNNGSSAQTEYSEEENSNSSETSLSLNKILSAILSLTVTSEKTEGVNTLGLNVDKLLAELGVDLSLGDIKLAVNPSTHEVTVTAAKESYTWLNFNAKTDSGDNLGVAPVPSDYIDIDFVETLLSDLEKNISSLGTKTVTAEDGTETEETDLRISLTGSLVVNISYSVISADVKINSVVATVGFDENDDFYFTLKGELQKETYAGFTVANKMPISVTYSGGYLTFGRTNDSGDAIYKVMTPAYLIDNLLDKSNSPIRWLLGTSSTAWNLIADSVKLDLNSGLTGKEYYYLYDNNTETEETSDVLSLASVLNGLNVKIDDYTSTFGSSVTEFSGVTDNYYSALIDLSSLIGSTFSPLRAAIVRNANGGLNGLLAYLAIKDGDSDGSSEVLKINVNLNGGIIPSVTSTYDETETHTHAENYFITVKKDNENINFDYDNGTERFGCYSTEDSSYAYSEYNKTYTVTVYGFADGTDLSTTAVDTKGSVEKKISLKSGSTVYLLEEETYLTNGNKLIYVDKSENDLGLQFTVTGDITVYAMIVGSGEVTFKYGDADCNVCGAVDAENNATNKLTLTTGEALPDPVATEITVNDVSYTFAGWYSDDSLENYVTSVQAGVSEYYAKYVQTTVTEANGVSYTFVRDSSEANGGHYVASGFSTSNVDGVDYTSTASTLVLANEINGYKVTEIFASAFKGTYIKNVVVPENIVTVGAQAFMDNYGIESVVFLAESVYLGGTTYEGDTDRYVFYGCSTTSGGTTTSLKVYYKNFTVADENWNTFRVESSLFSTTYHKLTETDGNLITSGWAYVRYKVECDYTAAELGLVNYLTTSATYDGKSEDEIKNAVYNLTVSQGYINGCTVEVHAENYSLSGLVVVTVTVNKGTDYYKFTLSSDTTGCTVDYTVEAAAENEAPNSITYGENVYIKNGATVTLTAAADEGGNYKFDGWTVSGISASVTETETESGKTYTLTINNTVVDTASNYAVTVTGSFKANDEVSITVYSEVAFTYQGTKYSVTDGNNTYTVTVSKSAKLEDPKYLSESSDESSGYQFLGWATADENEALTIVTKPVSQTATAAYTDSDTQTENTSVTYYALWVYSRDDVTFNNTVTSEDDSTTETKTTTVTATVNSGSDGSVYGWYMGTDTSFSGTQLESNTDGSYTLTASSTCVRVRLQYSLTVNFSANNTNWYYTKTSSDNYTDMTISNSSVSGGTTIESNTLKIDILEGYGVKVYKYWSNALAIRIYNDCNYTSCLNTYLIKGHNLKNKSNWRDLACDSSHGINFGSDKTWTCINGDSGSSNENYYHNATENSGLELASSTASKNLSFTVTA